MFLLFINYTLVGFKFCENIKGFLFHKSDFDDVGLQRSPEINKNVPSLDVLCDLDQQWV